MQIQICLWKIHIRQFWSANPNGSQVLHGYYESTHSSHCYTRTILGLKLKSDVFCVIVFVSLRHNRHHEPLPPWFGRLHVGKNTACFTNNILFSVIRTHSFTSACSVPIVWLLFFKISLSWDTNYVIIITPLQPLPSCWNYNSNVGAKGRYSDLHKVQIYNEKTF